MSNAATSDSNDDVRIPMADGTVTMRNGRHLMRFERDLPHPVERAWQALTDPALLSGWLADAKELELVVGGRLRFVCPGTGEEGAVGTVSEIEPPRVLAYDTEFFGLLRWELTPLANGCHIVSTVEKALPEDKVSEMLANWHVHMDFYADALDGKRVDWENFPMHVWEGIRDQYVAAAG
jgi:uncharacterized protein YndB with AHSA1/START domain